MALATRDVNGTIVLEPLFDPSFRAVQIGTVFATGKDISILAGPSATTVVTRLKRVLVTMYGAASGGSNAAGDMAVLLVKRSALSTNGSSDATALTIVQMDATSPAPLATAFNMIGTGGTVTNGATGAGYGTIGAVSLSAGLSGASGSTAQFAWNFTDKGDQPPTLRLATECFGVTITNGGTPAVGAKFDVEWQFEEGSN